MYVVIYLDTSVCCSHDIQKWLNEQFEKEGLELVSTIGNYFIFKKRSYIRLWTNPVTDEKVTPTITKGWQAQLDHIRTALNAALEELDDNEGDPRSCIEYALAQVRKLGLFGGLKEKEGSDRC